MLSKITARSNVAAIFVALALTIAATTVAPSALAQEEITEGEFALEENLTAPENVTAPEGEDAGLPPPPEDGFAP
jgi:hypothetical protein